MPHWILAQYIDFALCLSGSSLTEGIANEEPCGSPVSAMSGIIHVTPESTEPAHVMPAKLVPAHTMPLKPKPYVVLASP
ncbi:Elongation factor 2 [Labeo rohita]|uniref:Elongation factor 2 n=1 Tax=Labeo rohita TaxID=84645 RepID=A0ABQ8L3X3_LABRO|nr:Elongation factor 2 [Labeo rohita]